MQKTIISILLIAVAGVFAAAWTGSSSEPENMKKIDGKAFYVITTADELAWFAAQVNGGKTSINAVLNNDIVFGVNNTTTSSVVWNPVGIDLDHKFDGVLDGENFTIYGLMAKSKKYGGLVGVLGPNGVVKNLKFTKSSVSATSDAGSIAGVNYGTIENVSTSGTVSSASETAGGVVGWNTGSGVVRDCENSVNVSGKVKTGGIVGYNDGKILNSKNSGTIGLATVVYNASYGAITGINAGTIDNCVNTGSMNIQMTPSIDDQRSVYIYAGGVGQNNGTINRMWNKGSFSASSNYSAKWTDGYTVGANVYVGGIAGVNTKNVTNSRNDGAISAKIAKYGSAVAGAVVASRKNGSNIKNSFASTNFECWQNNTASTMTAANMKKDQFAWVLNTTNGTLTDSKVWSRENDFPIFAEAAYKAVFKVVFDDDGTTTNRYTNYKGFVTFPENPEPAEGLVFSGWFNTDDTKVKSSTVFTADQTVKAVYTDASDVFWTINFYNAALADTLLETKSYQHGSIVTYGGVEPTLTATAKYTYKFKGWDVEPTNAVEDFDYHAVYDSTIRSYAIVFNNSDGSKIESATFEYGKMPSCSKTPTRAATVEWKYTHKGWKPAIDVVTGEAVYTAIYDSVRVEYKVIFMNGTEVIDEQMVPYGEAAVAPTNVTREGYKFIGWNVSFAKITGDLTVKALFEELIVRTVNMVDGNGEKIDNQKIEDGKEYILPAAPKKEGFTFDGWYNDKGKLVGNPGDKITITEDLTLEAKYTAISYTITFVNENGSKISSVEVAYGQVPTAPKDPAKASTAQYTYTFKGWNPSITSVTGSATYTAVFDSTLREYAVTFKNGTTTLQTSEVAYGVKPSYTGITPTKVSTDKYSYTFKSWSPAITSVTGVATYTAVFDSTLREYAVTFKNGTTTLQTREVAYGVKPSYTGITPTKVSTDKYSYTFKGWNPTITSVIGAATYIAVFDSTLREYAVTFKNGTTTLQTGNVAYGTKPSYTGGTPTKSSTDKYSYTFKGWNPTLVSVTSAATYTAVFDSTLRNYTIAFKNGTTTLQTGNVAYGTKPSYTGNAPTKTSTDKYSYTFMGWNPTITSVTGAATYTAVFDSTLRKYTITFKNGTTTLQTSDVAYGTKPSYTGSTPTKKATNKYTYKFKGWNPAIAAVTKAATYQAVFDSTKVTGIVEGRLASLGLSVRAVSRSIQISAAPKNSTYAILDMQGRVLLKGRVESSNFNIAVPQAGSYLVRVGNATRKVQVK